MDNVAVVAVPAVATYHLNMANVSENQEWQGSLRRPRHWWLQFLDGQMWEFHEGEDFPQGGASRFRSAFSAYVNNYNRRSGVEGGVYKFRTAIKDVDGHQVLYVQTKTL